MGEYPLVSIIIITYNDRKYVGQSIESALSQTYPNCEIIVVDDGSTDGTERYIKERYGNKVKFVRKQNGGMGSARYVGLEIASGEYIQHLDSDDFLLPNKIKEQCEYIEANPDIAFVYGRTLCFYDDNKDQTWEHPTNAVAKSGNLFDDIIRNGNFINVIQPLFRRAWIDKVGGWDKYAKASDDYDIMVRLAYAGARGHFLDGEPVFLYRHRRVNNDEKAKHWRTHESLIRGELYILMKLRKIMLQDSYTELTYVTRRIGELNFSLGKILIMQNERLNGLNLIYKGLIEAPNNLKIKIPWLIAAILPFGPSLIKRKRRLFFGCGVQ
jgi:glycosyltransferase involved in cell wall biosynthesis